MTTDAMNKVAISGEVISLSGKRYTPSGIPIREGSLRHDSVQSEAGYELSVRVDLPFLIAGDKYSCQIGQHVLLLGFWGKKAVDQTLLLHVKEIKFL